MLLNAALMAVSKRTQAEAIRLLDEAEGLPTEVLRTGRIAQAKELLRGIANAPEIPGPPPQITGAN